MYYTQEQIDRANQADLVSFLQSQGEQLTRAGNEYRWKRHDSLTIRGNKWYRHSQSKGGGPVDFVMEFFGKSFTEAVELLTGEKGAAPPPDRPSLAPLSDFRLPPRSTDNRIARNYLTAARRIDEDVTGFFFSTGDIYEEAAHHNAVFVGRDESGIPRYAHQRGTAGNFRLDVKGSDKAFNFSYRGAGERLFVFEAPIDLLSFLCLFKKEWQKQSYLALGGVGEKALLRFLSDRPNIKTVYLCLDNDNAGNDACSRLAELVPEGLTVHRLVPLYNDWNEVLQHRAEIADGKYAVIVLAAVTGLRSVDIINLPLTAIDWINGEIRITQSKTEKTLALPLTKDVGMAIQDYILNGRPDSDLPFVFLHGRAPYVKMGRTLPYQIFNGYRLKLGLPKCAFHGLRRAVGTNMVVAGIPVTTVSQVLGHSGIDPTKQYISLDSVHLKECALDLNGFMPEGGGRA